MRAVGVDALDDENSFLRQQQPIRQWHSPVGLSIGFDDPSTANLRSFSLVAKVEIDLANLLLCPTLPANVAALPAAQ